MLHTAHTKQHTKVFTPLFQTYFDASYSSRIMETLKLTIGKTISVFCFIYECHKKERVILIKWTKKNQWFDSDARVERREKSAVCFCVCVCRYLYSICIRMYGICVRHQSYYTTQITLINSFYCSVSIRENIEYYWRTRAAIILTREKKINYKHIKCFRIKCIVIFCRW